VTGLIIEHSTTTDMAGQPLPPHEDDVIWHIVDRANHALAKNLFGHGPSHCRSRRPGPIRRRIIIGAENVYA
jgi:hypothetical protein